MRKVSSLEELAEIGIFFWWEFGIVMKSEENTDLPEKVERSFRTALIVWSKYIGYYPPIEAGNLVAIRKRLVNTIPKSDLGDLPPGYLCKKEWKKEWKAILPLCQEPGRFKACLFRCFGEYWSPSRKNIPSAPGKGIIDNRIIIKKGMSNPQRFVVPTKMAWNIFRYLMRIPVPDKMRESWSFFLAMQDFCAVFPKIQFLFWESFGWVSDFLGSNSFDYWSLCGTGHERSLTSWWATFQDHAKLIPEREFKLLQA